jgi:hypothetical protein
VCADPGYQETARMMIESALCMILDEHKLHNKFPSE